MAFTLIQRRNPVNGELNRFRDEMERTFENMLTDPLTEPRLFRVQGWMPVVDVSETGTEMVIRAEIPGIADKDVDVSIVGDALIISGEKKEETETSGEDWHRCERRFGSFRRIIDLPETVDADKAKAESGSGVVTVRIPKKVGVKPRHIEIKPSSNRAASFLP